VPFAGVQRDGSGLVRIDPQTGLTSLPHVFAAGSCVIGKLPFIHAVADGQRAARDIHAYLSGTRRPDVFVSCLTAMPLTRFDRSRSRPGGRHTLPPVLPAPVRQGAGLPAELSYPGGHARSEARRCLSCHINTIFDASRCNLCGKCVKACPEDVLTIVRADEAGEGTGVCVAAEVDESVILKDDGRCSRCGWCAMKCPEGAISMEALDVSGAPSAPRPGGAGAGGE